MLRYFPVAYEDELLYSQIGRYHVHTCSPGFKQTTEELFGSRTVAAVVDLPAHLNRLHRRTRHITRQTPTDILQRQTLYPLFAPFLGPELGARVRASMLSDYGGDIHTRAGLAASRLKRPEALRVCLVCFREQIRLNGEAWWQRLFQVTGVLVCPEHRVSLRRTPTPYVPFNKHQFTPVPRSWPENKGEPEFSSADVDKLVLVAEDARKLLASDYQPQGHAHWTLKYRQLLSDKGLTTGRKVNRAELHEGFVEFWGKSLLEVLSCGVKTKNEHGWLATMARKQRKNSHPLMHILFYRYLAGEDAPLAELFRPCSMVASETPPRKIPRQNQPVIEENKTRWLDLQKRYPHLHARELRRHAPALYMRLYRQDRDWLTGNTPRLERTERNNQRVDWRRRDKSIARKIIREARIYRRSDIRRRISRTLLARSVGHVASIEKHLALLPMTEKALNEYSESVTQYQFRRIDRAVDILRHNGGGVECWQIYRAANIRGDVAPEVKARIRAKSHETVDSCQVQKS